MTTETRPEYVVDVEHEPDCYGKSLCVIRHITQAAEPWVDTYEGENDGRPLAHVENANWEFEEAIEPLKLTCTMCHAWRYVAVDKYDTLIALTPENCIRNMVHHITNWKKPCEYCGYTGRQA